MLVVTPNTCTDIVSWLETLQPGTVSRSRRTVVSAGGKGVNVCRTLRALGATPRLVGLASGDDLRLEQLLAAEGCDFVPIHHRGDGRIALIMLEDGGRVSVINGQGPTPDQWDRGEFDVTIERELADTPAVICSGSLPPGLEVETYAGVVEAAHRHSVPAYVDAAPAVLEATLGAGPDLVSPNLGEAEALLHGRTDEPVDESGPDLADRCVAAARELHQRGAVRAIVTAGSTGAALVTSSGSWWNESARVPVVNPIGAGDSFIAATAHALVGGTDDLSALRYGMAVAAAAIQHETGGVVDPALIDPALRDLPAAVSR